MKHHKLISFLIIIIIFLTISISSAREVNNDPINYFELKDENIPWVGFTSIVTPFGDKAEMEVIDQYYLPKNATAKANLKMNQDGKLTSEIEYYQGDVKKNFSEFFFLESTDENFKIKSKELILNESAEIKFKYYFKPSYKFINIDNNNTNIQFNTNFYLNYDTLYEKYIFRIPTVNAHNLRLNFGRSQIQDTYQNNTWRNVTWAPVSKIYETDEYLEISYTFWNDYLVDKISLPKNEKFLTRLTPNENYYFVTHFSIEYETLREEWLIAIILSSIVAIFAFIGGALWVNREKK